MRTKSISNKPIFILVSSFWFLLLSSDSKAQKTQLDTIKASSIIKVGSDTTIYNQDSVITYYAYTDGDNYVEELYFSNGNVSVRHFYLKKNLESILKQEFYCSGEIFNVTNYFKGKRHGNEVYFDLNGNPVLIERYKRGKPKGIYYCEPMKYFELQKKAFDCN